MKTLILNLVTICAFLISYLVNAQDFQGKAYYQTQRKMEMSLEDSEMSDAQKEKMEAMLKKQFERTYILTFNKEASIYKEEEKLDAPSGNVQSGGMRVMVMGGNAGLEQYKNTKTKKFANEQDLFGKSFLVKDELETYNWEFTDESKIIGKYLCFKAVAKREVESMSFRVDSDDEEKSKDVEREKNERLVTAWYTADIPVSNGPDDYWGLPGLILELHDGDSMSYLCTKIVMNTKDKIEEPTSGKVVNQTEYRKLMEKKMKEMQQQYGGRERKGGGGESISIRIGG
ncbi:GLPGLI family protein [Urechidicola vernalis]|uniref:GLPGLI family protein n=1 Tax=Urechidicola vernalis TaxID=3075600 RepID=A0ABU2Y5R4_9FLAO|nr:GLPGLI family protein [Urechidicola sp. P050]MDT0553136.1 GLPGLI family protein [Urechidicola sp. P050]